MKTTIDSIRKAAIASRSADLLWLLKSGQFADFQIQCGGHTFDVHRAVIVQGCEYFKILTTSSFKEGIEARVTFKDDHPAVIARLIYYLYSGSCELGKALSELEITQFNQIDESELLDNTALYYAHLNTIALRLSIPNLARLAAYEFELEPHYPWSSTPAQWFAIVTYIYQTTTPAAQELKFTMVRDWHYLNQGIHTVDQGTSVAIMSMLQKTLESTPEFGFDIITMLLDDKMYMCEACEDFSGAIRIPCTHEPKHSRGDRNCFKQGLRTQSCERCGAVDALNPEKYRTYQASTIKVEEEEEDEEDE